MRQYAIFNKEGKAIYVTFDETRAFQVLDVDAGHTIEIQTIYMDDVNEFQYPTTTQENLL